MTNADSGHSRIKTFGCRLNIAESEMIRGFLEKSNDENILVFNTCGVTAEAERQGKQAIRRAYRENPNARIVVTGCAAQINPEVYAAMPEVSVVLGNTEKLKEESYSTTEKVLVSDIMIIQETAAHLIETFQTKARAFVQIQNGCNHRCTFCRIPYGRGNSRSVPAGELVSQIQKLVDNGHQEVVLTGVDITDYGLDLPGSPPLGNLISRILKLVPNLRRLRLSSLDPVEMDPELMTLLVSEPRLMPHVHLSVQAGDNLILKRMKRRHLREDVRRVCAELHARRPEIVFGADFIVGFPTETEEMFENTCRLVKEAGLTFLHVFPFSPHKDTPAARMPQVAGPLIKERAARLRALGDNQKELLFEKLLHTSMNVLWETETKGYAENFAPVTLRSGNATEGTIGSVSIVAHENNTLFGN